MNSFKDLLQTIDKELLPFSVKTCFGTSGIINVICYLQMKKLMWLQLARRKLSIIRRHQQW